MKKLPDCEFEIMKILWNSANSTDTAKSITTREIMEFFSDRNWKPQTLITQLNRLAEKGFVSSEKNGKERSYRPLINEEEYMEFETGNLMQKFERFSLVHLVDTLYNGQKLDQQEIEELKKWVEENAE